MDRITNLLEDTHQARKIILDSPEVELPDRVLPVQELLVLPVHQAVQELQDQEPVLQYNQHLKAIITSHLEAEPQTCLLLNLLRDQLQIRNNQKDLSLKYMKGPYLNQFQPLMILQS